MTVGRQRTARAIAIRDQILPALIAYGRLEKVRARKTSIPTTAWEVGSLMFLLRTPFARLPVMRPPSYEAALIEQQAKPVLGYGLDVWCDRAKVMSLQWQDSGVDVEVMSFRPGAWEADAVALSAFSQ